MTRDDERDALAVNPTLAVRPGVQSGDQPAEQGDAPDDVGERPTSGAPLPSGERLSAAEVTALIGGGGEDRTETTRTLEGAEALNPDTES